ncbi:uncharacterized protein KGF55_002713 [Candida pseudojiufengensis]|uniref:uncharacterized protein n=1 Tax=Candida pseudojiufengensis TaxID=497109 RepID=UPI0022254C97|nr:uncharacterized protein KGF55_002713 [Candida pseudojiufengensis]KAI5962921.1 hypothetical protein KGF55_002713 [Candida pseudojiufengensis]
MEKLVNFPIEVLELIFQQINHHMVIALMPLHSRFYEIGQKKLYKNIHIYLKRHLKKASPSEANKPDYELGWRAHKEILNDFTKKYTVISSCNFYVNINKNKMNRYQHIEHLSIENLEPVFYASKLSFESRKGVTPLFLRKIFKYFKNLDYVSFALSNNQLNRKNKDKSDDGIKGKTFLIPDELPDFYRHVLFLEEKNPRSYDFLYNNLKSLKFSFEPPDNSIKEYEHHELSKSIDLFNKINLFKKLEELHLTFDQLIDLMDPLLLERLNKINCKLKKLDLLFWAKFIFIADDKFKFEEILINANLPKLRNLILSSGTLDLKSIDVSKLHKLIICTDEANNRYATRIAKLYLINPSLRISWWPRFTDLYFDEILFNSDNLQIYSPDYFQIISCQWPSYFFKSDIISITKKDKSSSRKHNSKNSKELNIILKHDYSVEELHGMDMLDIECRDKPYKIFKKHDPFYKR